MSTEKIITLKPGKDQSVLRFHPWVFSGAIAKSTGEPTEGEIVAVKNAEGVLLGEGHFQPSTIQVRMVSFGEKEINDEFLSGRIREAWNRRVSLGFEQDPDTNIYRIVHGEGDDLPGLVIDRYGDTAVVQCHSVGFWLIREKIAQWLVDAAGGAIAHVYDKSEGSLPPKAKVEARNSWLIGEGGMPKGLEYGLKFRVDVVEGQKTGFFIDQRENRRLLEHYAKGREVMNVFCYTGGFSVSALRGGALKVLSVDSSKKAMQRTDENVALNFPEGAPHESLVFDAFELLASEDRKFDLIVLDPPAFAKHTSALTQALRAYRKINARAMELLRPGGILFTFSCSQVVSRDDFRRNVFTAATQTGRRVRILHQLTQPADHPVNIYHPEGEYLKGLVLEVS